MGVCFSHGRASWSCTGFNRFRSRLADLIGISLDEIAGYGGNKTFEGEEDPIVPLLDHSDCDGDLSPEECAKIAPRLKEMIGILSKRAESGESYEYEYDIIVGMRLAEGMAEAAEKNERFVFL